jgi:hypothetical protein
VPPIVHKLNCVSRHFSVIFIAHKSVDRDLVYDVGHTNLAKSKSAISEDHFSEWIGLE